MQNAKRKMQNDASGSSADARVLSPKTQDLRPFHWQIEFPEVFARPNGGFDAIVGNPPFMGGTWISGQLGSGFLEWAKTTWVGAGSRSDLVAYFFRRSFSLLNTHGCFGLIATNTIGQGDTRIAGLRWICNNGGTIYAARKRYRWPGAAAVVVSIVWVSRQHTSPPSDLDGHPVPIITAYLFHAGNHDNPASLRANRGKAYKGVDLCGMGFTFDDNDRNAFASPISLMRQLIRSNPRNAERIYPYIGGEEINDDPRHAHRRYAINFAEMTEDEARGWPELFGIIEQRVKPERLRTRDTQDGRRLKLYWWRYNRSRPELYAAIRGMPRVIACSQVSAHHQFAFLPCGMLYANYVIVFALGSYRAYSVLQSRCHEVWTSFLASSMKDDVRYTPSDCFETFPFPAGVLDAAAAQAATTSNQELATTNSPLDSAGREYYEFRAALMVRNNEGLTKTYNRFHDPYERSADILKLRQLHAAMDKAVLEAYGWHDLAERATCDFLLDYEDDEDDEEPAAPTRRARRKPWRYRWPDDFRDEVLARLLALNAERAEQERLTGAAETAQPKPKRAPRKKKPADPGQAELLD